MINDKPPYVWSLKTSDKLKFVFTNKELFVTVLALQRRGIPCIHPDYVKDYIIQHEQPDVNKYRADVYSHPVKKPTTLGFRKITSYMFKTGPKSGVTVRGLSVRDKNRTCLSNTCSGELNYYCLELLLWLLAGKTDKIKRQHTSSQVMSLTVSIPLDKVVLKRSHDPNALIDLTTDCVSDTVVSLTPPSSCVSTQSGDRVVLRSPTNCVTSQPPTDCVMLQPPTNCVTSQPLTDCVMLQPPTNCVMLQPPTNCVTSQPPTDCVMLQPPTNCVTSQPLTDCVMLQSPTDCVMSQPPTDCVTSQPPTDCVMSQQPISCDTLTVQSTSEDMQLGSHDSDEVSRVLCSSEVDHMMTCNRKRRKRKPLSVANILPQQEQVDNDRDSNSLRLATTSNGVVMMTNDEGRLVNSDRLPVINMMLQQRGLWSTALMVSTFIDSLM